MQSASEWENQRDFQYNLQLSHPENQCGEFESAFRSASYNQETQACASESRGAAWVKNLFHVGRTQGNQPYPPEYYWYHGKYEAVGRDAAQDLLRRVREIMEMLWIASQDT